MGLVELAIGERIANVGDGLADGGGGVGRERDESRDERGRFLRAPFTKALPARAHGAARGLLVAGGDRAAEGVGGHGRAAV